jgi:hypothetical protein
MHPVTVTAKKSPIIRINTLNIVVFLRFFIILPLYKNSVSSCLHWINPTGRKALHIQSYTNHPSKYYYTRLYRKVKKKAAQSG